MLSEIVAAVQSAKAAVGLVKAMHGVANYSELLTAVTTVQEQLTAAIASGLASQEKQAKLLERVRVLEKQVNEADDWNALMQRYALIEFPTGALAYELKPEMAKGQPSHYLCVSCADRKERSTLQRDERILNCPACKSCIEISSYERPLVRSGRPWTHRW